MWRKKKNTSWTIGLWIYFIEPLWDQVSPTQTLFQNKVGQGIHIGTSTKPMK